MTTTSHTPQRPPAALGPAGRALWRSIAKEHHLDAAQKAQLTEACRTKDRLDRLDRALQTDDHTWEAVTLPGGATVRIIVADPIGKANQSASTLKQLLASLRLPDPVTGRRPQRRGAARGAYIPGGKSAQRRRHRVIPPVPRLVRSAPDSVDPPG